VPKKILIVAGEVSGDLYGAELVNALKERHPEALFFGVGGTQMRSAGVEILFPIDELSIIGISEIFSKLNVIGALFKTMRQAVKEKHFDLAILVNYPGFNLRFSKVLKKNGVPVVFYSSPQIWAWGRWRLAAIRKCVAKMIVFMKFEKEFYAANGIEADFVGHPLVDIVKPEKGRSWLQEDRKRIVSLVPGSRKSEIGYMFPTMIGAAKKIYERDKAVTFIVTKHPDLPLQLYEKALRDCDLPLKVVEGKTYESLAISSLAICVSGSVTLEAAILRTPMIVTNRLSALTILMFAIFVRLKNVGLVNIIAGKRVMPELVQFDATPSKIAAEAVSMLTDRKRRERMAKDLEEVNELIGPPGASNRAAEIISKIL
jgi:lipid-A-disaccharide synthase